MAPLPILRLGWWRPGVWGAPTAVRGPATGATRRGRHQAGRARTKFVAQPPCSHRVELCGGGGAGPMRPGRATSALAHARVGERLRDLLARLLRALVPAQRSVVVAFHVALPVVVDVAEPLLGRAV